MKKSTTLIIVAIIILSFAFFDATAIPRQVYRDLISNGESDRNGKRVPIETIERENLFIETHAHRRLLQNFYLGASGLICLAAGLLALPNKNTNDVLAKSKPVNDK